MITRRQTLLGASAMAVAPLAIPGSNAGILEAVTYVPGLGLPDKLQKVSDLSITSLERLLAELHRAVHAELPDRHRIVPGHLFASSEIVDFFGSAPAARAAYDDAVRYADTVALGTEGSEAFGPSEGLPISLDDMLSVDYG